jgi:RNA recognition motif-containing protein
MSSEEQNNDSGSGDIIEDTLISSHVRNQDTENDTERTAVGSLLNEQYSGTIKENATRSNNLYVSNLHPRIVEPHLQKLFGSHGKISRLQVIRKPNLRNPLLTYSFAFIEFESFVSAQSAIEKIHGQKLLGKLLIVRYANEKNDSSFGAGTKRLSANAVVVGDDRMLKRQKSEVEKKIEAVKKALSKKSST